MIWPCRTFLLFLICATFFPKSRTQETTFSTTSIEDEGEEITSTDAEDEADDKTESTSKVTTTETAIDSSDQHLATESGPDESYLVRDPDNEYKICLALQFEGGFAIFYPDKHGKELKTDPSTSGGFDYDGTCEIEKETHCITLQWLGYNFTLIVNKTISGDAWQLKSMELKFNPQNVFEAPDEPSLATLSANTETLQMFTAPLDQSLSCIPSKPIILYTNDDTPAAFVAIHQMRLQAFDVGHEFESDSPCIEPVAKKESYQSDTAPIAVGSTLAVLTLGVIVGYAIYRSLVNKKVDYGNIQGE
uniref:Lysosome-associated membrane glycoprotein 5 n=1 Tax=Strigamia maritima TaxID=126957 RepID=T1IQN9_STRMM